MRCAHHILFHAKWAIKVASFHFIDFSFFFPLFRYISFPYIQCLSFWCSIWYVREYQLLPDTRQFTVLSWTICNHTRWCNQSRQHNKCQRGGWRWIYVHSSKHYRKVCIQTFVLLYTTTFPTEHHRWSPCEKKISSMQKIVLVAHFGFRKKPTFRVWCFLPAFDFEAGGRINI